MIFQCVNIHQVPRGVQKPRPPDSVFNISLWTWRMLMHEKTCLIPILEQSAVKLFGMCVYAGASIGFYERQPLALIQIYTQ